MEDDRRTVDRPEVRVDPIPIPPLPFEGARIQRERIDIDEFGATIGCQGCNAIKNNKRAQAHSDRCRMRIEACLRVTPHGAERLERRNEVINEALAEEVQRGEQRKKRCDRTTAAVPETESAAPESKENPIEPDVNPKRRLLMKSTTSAASDSGEMRENPIEPDADPRKRLLMKSVSSMAHSSGEQGQKRSIPDDESRMQVEDAPKADIAGDIV